MHLSRFDSGLRVWTTTPHGAESEMEVKTIYRVENAKELFDGLSTFRGPGDTMPLFVGHLRIDNGKVSFDGNVDVSLLTEEQVLKEAAQRLGLTGITIVCPASTRGVQYNGLMQNRITQ